MVENNTFTLLVCGSRDIKDYNFVFNTLDFLLSKKEIWEVKIINGAQKSYNKDTDTYYGADYFASQYATDVNIEFETFPAPWGGLPDTPRSVMKKNKSGKMYWPGAGMYRNKTMIDQNPDACVAFLGKNSKNIGTLGMIKLCEKAGIPVRKYYI